MTWVLVVTILLNGLPQTVEVRPFGDWMCHALANRIAQKTITLNGVMIPVLSATCRVDETQK